MIDGYHRNVRSVTLAGWRRLCAVPALAQDALLYLGAAAFAGVTAVMAVSSDYRTWGQTASVVYAAAAAVCLVAVRRARRHGSSARGTRFVAASRRTVLVAVILGCVVAPLSAQLVWRAEGVPGQHAQPEVAVVERAGDRVAQDRGPYLRSPTSVGISPRTDAKQVDSSAFFPYLPGMVPFGLPNALNAPPELQDARVALTSFTLLVGALALLWSDASVARRGRVLQFLVALPSGALPIVTGGDDLPVLALMLLGLVLAARRRPVLAGLALGLSGTLKFTAWPLLFMMLFAARDAEGRPAPIRYGLSAAAVALPVFAIGIASSPAAFIENVVRFPLGLTKLRSPAASPLFGQVLVNVLPHHKLAVTTLLLVAGAVIVIWGLIRYRPRTPAMVARFTAFAMLVATGLAPATRFGYLIYPVNLWIWAYLIDGMGSSFRSRQSALSTSNTVSDTVLVGALAPPSAGVMDSAVGATTTPTSQ